MERYNVVMGKEHSDYIRSFIKNIQGEKRYKHTLGVEKEAYILGKMFLPDKCDKLALAGLLHDITKNMSLEEHLKLCDEYKIKVDKTSIEPKLCIPKQDVNMQEERLELKW